MIKVANFPRNGRPQLAYLQQILYRLLYWRGRQPFPGAVYGQDFDSGRPNAFWALCGCGTGAHVPGHPGFHRRLVARVQCHR